MDQPTKYIRGPVSLVQLENKYLGKTVYVFGDVHTPESSCDLPGKIDIDEFIEQTIKQNPDKTLDVFLEFDYVGGEGEWKRSRVTRLKKDQGFMFNNTAEKFVNCIVKKMDECKKEFGSTRFQMIDARFFPGIATGAPMLPIINKAAFSKPVQDANSVVKTPNSFIEVRSKWTDIRFEDQTKTAFDALNELNFDDIWNCCKGGLEFSKAAESYSNEETKRRVKEFETYARNYFEARFKKHKTAVVEFITEYETNQAAPEAVKKYPDRTIPAAIYVIPALVMDIYTVGRMLKSEFKHIIVYVGDAHARPVIEVLTMRWKAVGEPDFVEHASPIKFEEIKTAKSNEKDKCIDLDGFRLPFFSSDVKAKDPSAQPPVMADTQTQTRQDTKGDVNQRTRTDTGRVNLDTKHSTGPTVTVNGEEMDTSPDGKDPFQMITRFRPVIRPGDQKDIDRLQQTQRDITDIAKGDVNRRPRTVTGLDNPELELPFWPFYHMDNQKATEYRPGDRLAVRIILPSGCVEIDSKKTGKSKAPINNNEKIDELSRQLHTALDGSKQFELLAPINLANLKTQVDQLKTKLIKEADARFRELKQQTVQNFNKAPRAEAKAKVKTTADELARKLREDIDTKYQEWKDADKAGQQKAAEAKAYYERLVKAVNEMTDQLGKLGAKVDTSGHCPSALGMEGDIDAKNVVCSSGGFFNHDCIEVFLIGEIQFVHAKNPLLNGEGVLYKLIPKQVVVDPPEYRKYVIENFVPEAKYLGVPIIYWLGVYEDLMSATIFITSAYKSLQQIVDDIGQERLDPTTRMAEYDVLAIRRSRMQGRFGLRESQVKVNPAEFLGKENPLPSAYGKTIVEHKVTAREKPQVQMFAYELPRKRKRPTRKRFS